MAKSARATRLKTNRQVLRGRVFAPVEDARTQRLSTKLLALAAKSIPRVKSMEVENDVAKDNTGGDRPVDGAIEGVMDLDDAPATTKKRSARSRGKKDVRPQKKRRAKASSTMTFTKPAKQKNQRASSGRRKR